jgi:PAS domain S-box-containing protein
LLELASQFEDSYLMLSLLAALLGNFFPHFDGSQRGAVRSKKSSRNARGRLPAWAVLGVSLLLTTAAWRFVESRAEASLERRFQSRVGLIRQALQAKMNGYEAAMSAGAAFIAASGQVSEQEWEQYVRSLRVLQTSPLAQLAFASMEDGAPGPGSVFPRLAAPAGPPPFSGTDLATVPQYREAMARARESGRTTVSEYGPPPRGGNAAPPALFLPVYAIPNSPAGASRNSARVAGWVVAWFQPETMFGMPRDPLVNDLDLEIFAGEEAHESHLLYDSDETFCAAAGGPAFVKRETLPLEVFGHNWTMAIGAKPEFSGGESDAATLVFVAGLVASLLLFVVTDSLASSRTRALAAAKLMTERLRQSEAYSRAVIENAPVGIVIVAANRSIDSVNSAAARMFGYRGHELSGWMFDELLADPSTFRVKGFQEFASFRKETGRRADGTTFPIELSAWPMQAAEQSKHTAIVVDVTERHQAAEALRAERDFSAAVLNVAPVLVAVLDPEGRIVSFNRACEETTGYRFEEVRGRYCLELFVPAEERAGVLRVASELCSGLYPNQHENHWLTKSGRRRLISWSDTVLRDARGLTRFVIACGVDITEQRQAQQERDRYVIELERAQHTTERQAEMLVKQADELAAARDAALESARLKSQFLANMSHEIRTPMSGVLGMTHLLVHTELSEEQRDYVTTIRGSAEALLVILNDILDFSKIEAGKLRFETLDFNLAKTVEGAVQLLRPHASAKGIELKSSIARGVPAWVRGDPGRLRQVLMNLIGNAIKFTERGHVAVSLTAADPSREPVELSFSVRDTGIGISAEARKNIFQAFVQADGSTSRKHGGTGLGLAISQQLVQRMGGEIGCESMPGEGSLFWFTVKLGKPATDKIQCLKELRVLAVAEQDADSDFLKHNLESWEIEVRCAASPAEAFEMLARAQAAGRGFTTVIVQAAAQAFAEFVEAVRANPQIAAVEILAWRQEQIEPYIARLRELRVNVAVHNASEASDLFNALMDMASHRAGGACQTPCADESAAAPERGGAAAPRAGKVLIVEDNLVNQKVALRMLQNLGCDADLAENGLQALQSLEHASYDLILMDCQMPEMDGYQATTEIRRRENGRARMPIIALTAHAMQGDRERCLQAGMDDYLSKPINPDALIAALRRWGLTPVKRETKTPARASRPVDSR